ncbi:ABC transporter permease [Cohnella phaseoli]|uniref:ABC-2 family transporter n=1 Tax=Cohnella phaseoli TaxID=456490 RepID=A0A3D9HSJ2_9BACL|nr:ABC transporter permease [Cohnella phaseoli]RED51826.1 ABC-2 family transporter [Cohnella phaseoli]
MSAEVARSRSREFVQALAAELSKLWSLPAVWLTLGGSLIVNLILAAAFVSAGLQGLTGTPYVLDIGLASISYIQAGFIILGIVASCSEYTGGQIRTTLTAIPRRSLQLVAAHLALTIVVIPAAIITAASGVLFAAIALGNASASMELGSTVRMLAGATGYLGSTTLISASCGVLLRRTLPAAIALLGYYFIAGPLLREQTTQARYLPDTAGFAMWFPQPEDASALSAAQGAFVLVAWTLAAFAISLAVYRSRDA